MSFSVNWKSVLTGSLLWGSFTFLQAESPAEPKAQLLITGLELHQLRNDKKAPELGVYDSYEEAQELEAEIVQMYREIRAAELSLIQRQTLERSLVSTLTPLSERASVDAALLTDSAKDAETVKLYQKELGVVIQETDAIVANARELLNSFIVESTTPPPPLSEDVPPPEPLTPEEIAEMVTQPQVELSEIEQLEMEQQQQELQEQQAELEKQIQQELANVEMNLEEALEEIKDAQEVVKEELKEVEKQVEEKEQELAEVDSTETEPEKKEELQAEKAEELAVEKEKQEELKELEEKIVEAEKVVAKVVEDLKNVVEVPEEQVEKAEEVVKELREALAKVQEADEAVPEVEQQAAKEHTEEAVEQMESAQAAMETASQAMKEMATMAQLLKEMEAGKKLSKDNAIAQMQSLGSLANAGSGRWLDITAQMRGKNLNMPPVEVPENQRPSLWGKNELNSAPSARKVIPSSTRGGQWIFIGDWYVLSRYDNPHRANRQKVYPPESILDIDARYASEDGKPMRWEYESFMPPYVKPYGWEEWKIYYFYTELYFEEATDAWLAIGSDDRSDIWINDLPIWHSSNEHKNWRANEGFRKVHFKQGRNKVLVRLENGHHGMSFSLYMNLHDGPRPTAP
ncbi:hypothetical protein P3T73_04830 [Kiritimatiellota bacterium B12222]|nr:hypothetical protein P3T73_04830 [Kiritimatiellota bacterium B12222]